MSGRLYHCDRGFLAWLDLRIGGAQLGSCAKLSSRGLCPIYLVVAVPFRGVFPLLQFAILDSGLFLWPFLGRFYCNYCLGGVFPLNVDFHDFSFVEIIPYVWVFFWAVFLIARSLVLLWQLGGLTAGFLLL